MMNFLEEKILSDGVIKPGNILKIDNFLNHQIDIGIIRQIATELKRRFRDVEVNKILTIEASGIAMATMLGHLYDVPVVFAKKSETANSTDNKYVSHAYSFTHKKENKVFQQKGGSILREEGYRLESIAIIEGMDYETQTIHFRNQDERQ